MLGPADDESSAVAFELWKSLDVIAELSICLVMMWYYYLQNLWGVKYKL